MSPDAAAVEPVWDRFEIHLPLIRVLIAEDHERVAVQLRRLLETECDVVGVVSNGQTLVAAVDVLAPEVIVTDVTMPGLDGLTAARVILSKQRDARIVFVTVHDDPGLVEMAFLVGAFGYVLKADASEELLAAVRAAQAGHTHISANARSRMT